MAVGFVYASYIAHVANAGIKTAWAEVMLAVSAQDVAMVEQQFNIIAELTEKRGRIMNSHSHLGACGLLLLLLAILQPLLNINQQSRLLLAYTLTVGALLQFFGVLGSYYFQRELLILSDIGSLLLLIGVVATLYGFSIKPGGNSAIGLQEFINSRLDSICSLLLLRGAISLILICILLGIYLAWLIVSGTEAASLQAVSQSAMHLLQHDVAAAQASIAEFKTLQTKMAINAAAHSHGLEMAILMLLLALLHQSFNIRETLLKKWCIVFIALSYVFPLWIYLAINVHFSFAKFANYTGATLGVLLIILLVTLFHKPNTQQAH